MVTECVWVNTWTDSGDRGAAAVEHERHYHPDHVHDYDWSKYEWEQKGQPHIASGDRTRITPRPNTVMRCMICHIRKGDDQEGKCM